MIQEQIKVGVTTMFAETVPVNVIFEELYDTPGILNGNAMSDRFQLIELDGYYLVIHEIIQDDETKQYFKCFTHKKDAYSFLEMHGIEMEME